MAGKDFSSPSSDLMFLDLIYEFYHDNPKQLARDAGVTQRTARNWLQAKHMLRSGDTLLRLMLSNRAFGLRWVIDYIDDLSRINEKRSRIL